MGFAFTFGTAGIRARAGDAPGELNLRSVRVIACGIARGLAQTVPDPGAHTLCVGFDGRRDSQAFAAEVSAVLLGHGFRVDHFEQPCPTPLLAFCVRRRAALAGVMVTASHNPPEDNGIKLYLTGGVSVASPLDRAIEAEIAAVDDPDSVTRADLVEARARAHLGVLGQLEFDTYVQALMELLPGASAAALPKLAYSALCGVGGPVARALLTRLGAQDWVEVEEQAAPQADFGGLRSPNPEEPSALVRLTERAQAERCALAFAHDPDADRLAVLARARDGSLRSLSGDEVGALIGDFLLSRHPAPGATLLVSTLVSGGLLARICAARGAHFLRTPTGFKWIAKLGREHAAATGLELLFGYEEALGYAFFAQADDKDGSAAMRVLCELARQQAARGATLLDRLDELVREHGLFATRQLSVSLAGRSDGPAQIAALMQRLRALSPAALLGAGARCEDYEQAQPKTALLVLHDATDTRVCIRPSGTEPKLKLYLHLREPVRDTVAQAEAAAQARLNALASTLAPYLKA